MIHRVDPIKDERWARFLERHPKASVFHSAGWLEALQKTYGYEPIVFTTSAPEEELKNGLLVCKIDSWVTGRRFVSLPFSDHCDPLWDTTENLGSMIGYVRNVVEQEKLKYVEIRPTEETFEHTGAENGFTPSAKFYFHVLDLTPDLDTIYRRLDKDSVQRRVRRAERAELVEKSGTSEELLQAFYELFVVTRSRHHLPPIPYGWFRNLIQGLGCAVEIRVAYKEDSPIASILTLRFNSTIYYKYGCSDTRFNSFGATPWLFWRAIEAAKAWGATTFDLGRTEEDNPGLFAFKNHWVSNPKCLTYWRYPESPSAVSAGSWKLDMAKSVFSHLPNGLLKVVGEVLYRHIG